MCGASSVTTNTTKLASAENPDPPPTTTHDGSSVVTPPPLSRSPTQSNNRISTAASPRRVAAAGVATALQLAMNCSLAREVRTANKPTSNSNPPRSSPTRCLRRLLFRRSLRTLSDVMPRVRATTYVLPTSIDSSSQIKEPPPTYPSILPLAGDEIPLSQQGTPAGNKKE